MASRRTQARDFRTDAARGALVAATAAGLLAGPAGTLPDPLGPAAWHGIGATDLVIGAFLVVSGMSVARMRAQPRSGLGWTLRWIRRFAILLGVGLATSWIVQGEPWRWTGPLQRLALAGLVAWAVLSFPRRWQAGLGALLVGGHTVFLLFGPLDGAGSLSPTRNVSAGLDVRWLGDHALGPTDPEGLLSLLTAAALVVAGAWIAGWIDARPDGPATAAALVVAGGWLAVAALGLSLIVPVNRTLATAPWGVLSVAATMGLVAVAHAVRVAHLTWLAAPLDRLGRHALPVVTTAVLAGALVVGDGSSGLWAGLRNGLVEPLAGSASTAVFAVLGIALALWLARTLDRRGWRLTA